VRARIHRPNLRTTLSLGIAVLGAIALAAAVALVALTNLLDRATRAITVADRSVRLAEELELDLLSHDRIPEPAARADLGADLRRRFDQIEIHVADAREAALLQQVRRSAAQYLDQLDRGAAARPDAVFGDLHQLIALNAEQAREASEGAEHLNRIATVLGALIAVLLVAGAGSLLVWLRRYAFRPVFHIGDAMGRFGRGERSARAPERGPEELCEIAQRFNQMAEALERQRIAQLTFLAGVAHDLRNPLAALRSSAELLDGSAPPAEERLRRVSAIVHRQVDRIDRMLGDLLDAARIEAGELELRREVCSVSNIAEEIVGLYRESTRSHQIELEAEETAIVQADPTRLGQVLTNLISNGIKYSPGGGTVAVAVAVDGDEVAISVADQGIGIDPADLARIFEPFQRAGAARDAAPGTGLGLSVVRRIVEAHGGRIRVDSRPGRGSVFEVRLERAPARSSASSPPT
jgi:signal transduction histidine kinase